MEWTWSLHGRYTGFWTQIDGAPSEMDGMGHAPSVSIPWGSHWCLILLGAENTQQTYIG